MAPAAPDCASAASAERSRSCAKKRAAFFSIAVTTGFLPRSGALTVNHTRARDAASTSTTPAIFNCLLYFNKDLSTGFLNVQISKWRAGHGRVRCAATGVSTDWGGALRRIRGEITPL